MGVSGSKEPDLFISFTDVYMHLLAIALYKLRSVVYTQYQCSLYVLLIIAIITSLSVQERRQMQRHRVCNFAVCTKISA